MVNRIMLIFLRTRYFNHKFIDTDLRIKTLVLHECPLWKNDSIGRELSHDGIRIVMDDFVRSGHGEWEDPDLRTRCRILWRKPEQLASDIYDWAVANGKINDVCTVYELHSGEFALAR
jgi:ESCRT-II complex subunit VPS25